MSPPEEKPKTSRKSKPRILHYLEILASSMPGPIYWKDKNSVYLGMNQFTLEATGVKSAKDFIGKTDYDLWPEFAEELIRNDQEVIRTGKPLHTEEEITGPDGRVKYFAAVKVPLKDDSGNIIGIIGNSIDITAEKEAARLKIENERLAAENQTHKIHLEEQIKFKKIADQVAHDIRSPLAALLMIVKSCNEIPEEDRISLREAAMTIQDIANSLLVRYKKDAPKSEDNNTTSTNLDAALSTDESEERQPVLVSALSLQLLTDKKYQYQERTLTFDHEFTQAGNFAFIKIAPTSLKRSISNLINNAVDALDKANTKEKRILLKLDASKEWVKISIQDNGKGMPAAVKDKILNNLAVTSGKKEGHGIGLTQVRETLQANQGELSIESQEGKGTCMTLSFPRIKTPSWMGDEIILGASDIIVILDDDKSIHKAWDMHFEGILKQNPGIKLHHFQQGKEALNFINGLSPADKNKVFLLSDYELLKQDLNGLHVIEQSKVERSLLVTSHYVNEAVRSHASKTGTKILPKQLASEIPIRIDQNFKYQTDAENKKVDAVLIDDDASFTKIMIAVYAGDLTVDSYQDPEHFLKNLSKYSKDTPIYMDNQLPHISGLALAKQLHEQGYTRLYMLTGEAIPEERRPSYLTVLLKDPDNLEKIFKL